MNIEFIQRENDQLWDSNVKTLSNYSFLNSSARLSFLKEQDSELVDYSIMVDGNFAGVLTGSIGKSKIFGKYLEFKHSPTVKKEYNGKEVWEYIFDFCRNIAEENNCFMYRVAPFYKENPALEAVYSDLRMAKAPVHNIDALVSQYFDLSKSEEDLRHDMSSSTRNNINKLLKNEDVSVKIFNDNSQFDIFREFHKQTKQLKGYVDKPAEVLLSELQEQVDNGMCYMVVGYFKNKPISVWQCTVFGKYMHIYQAGSDTEFREKNVRITYLLFWECVKLAKELGCEVLDLFGGMVPENYIGDNHPWNGVNGFKTSLGGTKTTYMHPRDYAVKKLKYKAYYIYSKFREEQKGYTIDW